MKKIALLATLSALAFSTAACVSTPDAKTGQYVPVVGPAPVENVSPMSRAYDCFAQATRLGNVRIAVGQMPDYSGKFSNEASEGGFRVTQGGALMIMSALGKLPGIRQVERYDMAIASNEVGFTNNRMINDDGALRPVMEAQIVGSDYYIVGGITEVNYNIASGGTRVGISLIEAGKRAYVSSVAVDLRLVNTRTLETVNTFSATKQIVGYEESANVFRFAGDTLIDLEAGTKKNEPFQLAVRTAIQYATAELLSPLYGNYFDQCKTQIDQRYFVLTREDLRNVPAAAQG